jgi:hypothetical protein
VTSETKAGLVVGCIVAAVIGCLIAFGVGMKWYRAGIQQEVYRRQGCEMSRWEVFMGAKPIDRQLVPQK